MTWKKSDWKEVELKTLRYMWLAGASASDISRALPGRTRNSVLGIVHRSKDLPRRLTTFLRAKPTVVRAAPGPKPKVKALPAEELLPWDPPICTMDLRDHHCHWPFDVPGERDFIYCGRELRKGSPYCAGHSKIAFQPKQEYHRRVR